MRNIQFFKDYKALFAAHGFLTVDDFLNYDGGVLVSKPEKRPVRTLEIGDTRFYVKQERYEGSRALFKRVLNRTAHTALYKEHKIIDLCVESKIPVMEKAVFGEKTILGAATGGVLVVKEVKGDLFYASYNGSDDRQKKRLAKSFGRLLASLHDEGIDSNVRVRDLIVAPEVQGSKQALVLVDRERGSINRGPLSDSFCAQQMGKILIKSFGLLNRISVFCLLAFLSGYTERRNFDTQRTIKLVNEFTRFVLDESKDKREEVVKLLGM